MAAQDYVAVVEQLYVSYFGRPADYFGLQNFTARLDALKAPTDFVTLNAVVQADKAGTSDLAKLVNSFNGSAESAALYGTDNSQVGLSKFVEAIYQNLLNRSPDVAGWAFWTGEIAAGRLTRANAAMAITEGALKNTTAQGLLDAKAVQNKLAVATNFTAALDTVPEINAYSGDAAAAAARGLVHGVDNTTDVAAYQSTVNAAVAALVTAATPVTNLTLTTGVDTLTGGAGNDVFTGVVGTVTSGITLVSAPTLSAADTLDGGAGNNTLKVIDQVGNTLISGYNTTNIQTLSVVSTGIANIDTTSGLSGVTAINVTQSTGNDTIKASAGQSVSVVDSAGVVTINGASTTQTVTTAGGVVLSGASGAIKVTDTLQSANSTVDGGTTVTYNNTTAVGGNTIIIGGTTKPTGDVVVNQNLAAAKGASIVGGAITVNGGTTVTVTETVTKNLATATAAGAANGTTTQSAVNVNGSALTTTVTVNQTAVATASPSKTAITAVAETATVKFDVLKAGESLTIAGLTLTAGATDMTAKEVAAAFANLSDAVAVGFTSGAVGGANSDTVVFTDSTGGGNVGDLVPVLSALATSTLPTVSTVDGIASQNAGGKVGVVAGAVAIVDAGAGTGKGTITTVTLSNYGNSTINDDAIATLNLSGKSGTLGITNIGTKTLDANLNGLSGANTITVNAAGAGQFTTVKLHTNTADSTLAGFADGKTAALTVDGDHKLTLTSAAGLTALKTITVSGSAGLEVGTVLTTVTDVNASATSGAVTVAIDATAATYEGGTGVDTVTIGAAPTKAISGGAGNDVLVVNFAGGFNASGNTNISGFETLGAGVLADGTYDATGFAHLTAGAIANAVTFSNVAAGVDLAFTNTTGFATTYALKDATGTSDALAVSLTKAGAIDLSGAAGLTAAGIESLTIKANDVSSNAVAGATVDQLHVTDTALKTVTITGNTTLELDLTGNTKVTTVDASGMTGGLTYTTAGTVAETVKGGASSNVLTAAAGTTADVLIGGASNDTLTANAGLDTLTGGGGNDIFVIATPSANVNSYATITDASAGDVIQFADLGVEVFTAAKISLGATAVFQDYANAAINAGGDSSANAHISWFQFNGDTYIVESQHNAVTTHDFQNGVDAIVKLTGLRDLSTAVLLEDGAGVPTIIVH